MVAALGKVTAVERYLTTIKMYGSPYLECACVCHLGVHGIRVCVCVCLCHLGVVAVKRVGGSY